MLSGVGGEIGTDPTSTKRKMSGGVGAAATRASPKMNRSMSSSTTGSALGGAASLSAMDSDAGASDQLLSQDSGIDESMALPLSLIKGLRRKSSSIGIGSSISNGGGSGNNSDNSALVSLGNNSFGFNFDSEEAMLSNSGSSPNNSEPDGKDGEGGGSDSDNGKSPVEVTASSMNEASSSSGGGPAMQVDATPATVAAAASAAQGGVRQAGQSGGVGQHMPPVSKPSSSSLNSQRSGSGSSDTGSRDGDSGGDSGSGCGSASGGSSGTNGNGSSRSSGKSTVSSITMSSNSNNDRSSHCANGNSTGSHEEAAAAAVAHLQSIANSFAPQKMVSNEAKKTQARSSARASVQPKKSSGTKRKAVADDDEEDNDSGGYNSDDEGGMAASRGAPLCDATTAPRAAPEVAMSASSAGAAAAMAASKLAAAMQVQQPPPPNAADLARPLVQAPAAVVAPALPAQLPSRDATSTGDPNEEEAAFDGSVPVEDSSSSRQPAPKKTKKVLDESKREERNAREKERSFRISRQINDLRNLLSSGGVIVPKGTKSAVLTEAANYIRMLQQHQYRSEIDRHQLVQQMQIIGSGALGPQAATAIRHVAAQNGVWSLGNFGGVPPRSAMTYYQQGPLGAQGPAPPDNAQPQQTPQPPHPQQPKQDPQLVTKIDDHEYRYVFNSCSVGMAIASMGGAFIDCNSLFCQLSQYTKQEVCAMTIFNLTSRQDLQHAFDLISKMISPPPDGSNQNPPPCVLRGAMKHRNDLGLSIALIKGEDGIAKCFCVTLIKNPASPFDTSRPIPATADFLQPGGMQIAQPITDDAQKSQSSGSLSSPAYTTG